MQSNNGPANLTEAETLSNIYVTAKAMLRTVSMYRSGVLEADQRDKELREQSEFLCLFIDELVRSPLSPTDDSVADVIDWMLRTRIVYGALKQTIDAHGPITSTWIGSAAKRIIGTMRKRMNNYRRLRVRRRKRNGGEGKQKSRQQRSSASD